MRKLIFLLLGLLFLRGEIFAQNRVVTGRVTDSAGNPVANASVMIRGSSKGTTTGTDGNFSLTVPSNVRTLSFSSVGYANRDVSIGNQSSLVIALTAQAGAGLEEVVVTAYGGTRRRAFTGTASTINAEKFKDLQVSTITGVLQGNASGVLAVSSNGQPGESPTIRVRGIGSVNASADPLIVVDGAQYGGNINNINPNDIESITVLKDASSTALYGSRAANGVIQITTKTGRGTPKVSISALTGFSTRAVSDYDYVNSNQIYELTWEALRNQALVTPTLITSTGSTSAEDYASKTVVATLVYNPFKLAQPVAANGKIVPNTPLLWNENWANDLLQTGVRKDVNASVSGGTDKSRYFISGGYLDDQGIAVESKFKRYTGRLKIDNKLKDWLTVGLNTNLAYSTQNYPAQGGSAYSNVIGWIRGASSIFPQYLVDPATGSYLLDANGQKQYDFGNNGPLVRPYGKGSNPAGTTSLNPTSYTRNITSTNAYAEIEFTKGLKLRSQYALDLNQIGQNTYYNPFVGDGSAYGGRSYKSRNNSTTQTFTNTLTYDRTLGSNHHLNALVGQEAYKFHESDVAAEARGFTFPNVTELSYGSTPFTSTSSSYDDRLTSYFGRLNYDFSDKYHLSLSLRRDGSTRFADSVRWGTFYSVGGAWNINKESFFNNITFFNDLKLRASYGTTGNQALTSYFPYLGGYSSGANIAGYSGSTISSATNGALTWETQKTLDLGLDYSILKNRISGSVTYFTRTSDKLQFNRPLPPSSGLNGVNDNIGSVKNYGVEIDLNTVNIRTRNFQWSTSINLSHIKNKITSLPQASIAGSNFSNLIVGESLYNFYIREYAGVDKADGRPLWYIDKTDAAGKVTRDTTHTYSAATRYYKGTALPDWTGGFTNTVRFQNFDFTVLVSFSLGGLIYDADYAGLMYETVGNQPGVNWNTDILGRWQSTTNPGDGKTPKLTTTTDYQGNSSSTRFLFNDSYARVRNVTLGYHIPSSILERAKISNARFYVDWQNPFTFFGRKGLDPEAGVASVTSNTSAVYKTISAGVNFDF
ncbi:MAG: SusC/RagA family TonB-linked outer membrane protein [Williamsia sp.]|nr:SusC/RagA family TonB-linked outer membrane protein [Williamsia sp.]